MGGAHADLRLADVFRDGPVNAREVACCQRLGIKQAEVAYAQAHELLDHCRSGTTAADDSDTEVAEDFLDFAAEGANVPVELLRGRLCLVEPIPGERESPAGYPQTIDVVAAVVRFDVTGETETSPGPGKDHCSIPGAPRAEPEEVGELLVDGFVMPARSGR